MRAGKETDGSAASCKTLALKESQLISRGIVFRLDPAIKISLLKMTVKFGIN